MVNHKLLRGTALAIQKAGKGFLSRTETSAMQIGEVISLASRQKGSRAPRRDEPTPAPECRALVALTPTAAPNQPVVYRNAAFLAHLIATKEQLPQARERRRAEPSDAIAAYRATASLKA